MAGDPIRDALGKAGIQLEPREATAVEQMVAGGVGGIAGTALGMAAGWGWIGKALASLGGAIAGHLIVTHRVRFERGPEPGEPAVPAPQAPR